MKAMLKVMTICLILSLFIFVEGKVLHAECSNDKITSTLTNFYSTIQKLEISKDGGATYFTVFDNSTDEVDLVAVSGQNVGSVLGTNSNIPAGRYNYSRVTVSNSRIVFSLSCTNPGEHAATQTGTLEIGNKNGSYPPDQGYPIIEEGAIDLTVTAGSTTNAVMNFDAATSYAGSTFEHQAGAVFTPGTFVFDPQITVAE